MLTLPQIALIASDTPHILYDADKYIDKDDKKGGKNSRSYKMQEEANRRMQERMKMRESQTIEQIFNNY